MNLSEFAFSYRHETAECQLSTRNVGLDVYFYFAIDGPGRGQGHRDSALTTRVSTTRILRKDVVDSVALATQLLVDILCTWRATAPQTSAR
jgi:hypothetical protein